MTRIWDGDTFIQVPDLEVYLPKFGTVVIESVSKCEKCTPVRYMARTENGQMIWVNRGEVKRLKVWA